MDKQIAVLPGDGIGPEVVEQALKVLDAIGDFYDHRFTYSFGDIGAAAIGKHGLPLPESTLGLCRKADAILLGAVGDPVYDGNPEVKMRPEQGLLAIRRELGLYCNIRPVTTYASLLSASPLREEIIKGVDIVIYRELTGGIYFGEKGETADGAYDHCTYTREEVSRISHLAFRAAKERSGKLCLVDKANVLQTSRLWRKVVKEIRDEFYPEVELECMFVDNAAMQLILNPRRFDVVLTENMFGDILSDVASVIGGSLGLLPSGSTGDKVALYEPVHGSYPQAKGKNIANPVAAILSAAMMLEGFELYEEAEAVRSAVSFAMESGRVTPDIDPHSSCGTKEVGDVISAVILQGYSDENYGNMNKILGQSTII